MIRSLRLAVLGTLAAVALATSATACAGTDSDSNTLTVGFVVDPSWAQIPVAADTGLFDKQGVKVKVVNFSSGVEALQAMSAGQVDITTAADVPTAAALTHAPSLRIVGDGSRWQGSKIVARRDAGISSVSDLAHKSIGTPLGTSAAYYISNALATEHVDARLVQVSPSAMVTAIGQRNVDAISIFQPYQAQAITALGGDAIELTGGTYSQHSLFLSSESAISSKKEAITKFFAAVRDAGTALSSGSSDAVTAVAKATQLDAGLLRSVLSEFDFTLQLDPGLATSLQDLAEWARSEGNIDAKAVLPDYGARLDTQFVTG
ncbi:ABC transporter substrate-binding protein [Williamsia sterculiae]|uniref:NitT/TauT family transport system substrate-binding protein n=1 Tax=Williamsia sterculiae TaxID=1344003 RepID=A0A1N7HFU1_9NOCA|nr:ABC transporter substrate-binding protein [Williamsia sterculiae]SIS23756.1 NitT/TauT family transport system substrate-binding protein [Williamsia sterculiae]